MKKVLGLVFISLFLLCILLIVKDNSTYAFTNCENKTIEPKEVTTLNLEKYIYENNIKELKEMCSFDMCYKVREDNINSSINNFKKIFDKYLSDEEYYELNVKGYPITKLVVRTC